MHEYNMQNKMHDQIRICIINMRSEIKLKDKYQVQLNKQILKSTKTLMVGSEFEPGGHRKEGTAKSTEISLYIRIRTGNHDF